MSGYRKITDASELREVNASGHGYVFHPFGRVVHAAACSRVATMSLNPKEPRWFAPDAEAARAYQRRRLEAYTSAKPFERASCCRTLIDPEAIVAGAGPASGSARPTGRSWCVRGPSDEGGTVELWTVRRTPYTTSRSPAQKDMVRELEPRLRRLECDAGERLHGMFTSDERESRQPDAENICFYNFGARPFSGVGAAIGFERSFGPAPPAPPELHLLRATTTSGV